MRRAIVAVAIAAGVAGFVMSAQAQSEKKAYSPQTSVTGGVALPAAANNDKATVTGGTGGPVPALATGNAGVVAPGSISTVKSSQE